MKNFDDYRPKPSYPKYPPYHQGEYLEDYFYNFYCNSKQKTTREFIPVSWTTCYIENKTDKLQENLNKLDPKKSYFAVSQHDDAIKEKLPPDTVKFCAGGNRGGIPIPLVCSQIPSKDIQTKKRDLLCSFYGSLTHQIRFDLCKKLENKPHTLVKIKSWKPKIDASDYMGFIDCALRSKFLLCPRGYGLNSFRIYEAFQLGCVPVIISDNRFLPWEEELDWESFSVLTKDVSGLYQKLKNITEPRYKEILNKGQKLYYDYFSISGVCKQIIKRLIASN